MERILEAILDNHSQHQRGLQRIMDQISALQTSVNNMTATLGQIATVQAKTDADLAAAVANVATLTAELANQPALSPAAQQALSAVQTSVTQAANNASAILSALQAGDPASVVVPPTSGTATSGTATSGTAT